MKNITTKLLCLATLLVATMWTANAVVVTYTPDNTTVFKNPERGFTEECSYGVSKTHPNVVKGNVDEKWGQKENMTLMVVLYNFRCYKDQDIDEEVLAGFDEDMQELRDHGLKCVLRFAYTENENDNVDAKPEWAQRHMEQLQPHLAKNTDVIYVLEAGFVGVWGEWYYSANYGNETQHMNKNRRFIIDKLFANVPSELFILFRYPMIKTEYLNDEEPLTAEEGFSGTVKARMGCHNDAFLNNYGNHGTYASDDLSDDPKVREYIAKETLYVPNGGETNVESNSSAERVYTKAPAEMSEYHWSFCGKSYAQAVTKRWRESGIFDELNAHMGYRFMMINCEFSDKAAPTGKMNVTVRLVNAGYAPIYNERPVYLVLKGDNKTYSLPLKADPRRWLPNYASSAINEQVTIPADMLEGTYHLYLHLPDKHASIAADPRYAVRLADENVWDEKTGWNDLGASVVISKEAPLDPGELPDGINTPTSDPSQRRGEKFIKEGQLLIRANGKVYDAQGKGI